MATGTSLLTPERLVALAEVFDCLLVVERLHPGAQLAVYHRGALAFERVGGYADSQACRMVQPDTLFPLLSAGKPFGSLALLQQIDAGRAALDDKVPKFWPEFAGGGKADVTLRHVLTHTGGFPQFPEGLTWQEMRQREPMISAIERMVPAFPAGEALAYHHLTQQWACLEVVRRIDGRPFAQYMREMVTGPLGMENTHFGVPEGWEPRVARQHAMERLDQFASDMTSRINARESHASDAPVFAVSTAGDMARFYAALTAGGALDGCRLLSSRLVDEALEVDVAAQVDRVTEVEAQWGLGFQLGGVGAPAERAFGTTSSQDTFGHLGGGQVLTWGDTKLGLSMAFMSNGQNSPAVGLRRRHTISDAVRALVE